MPAPSRTLDAHLYPHIFDVILQHVGPRTLLAIERTSKAMRERVKPLLYRHVMVSPGGRWGNLAVFHLPCRPWAVLGVISYWETNVYVSGNYDQVFEVFSQSGSKAERFGE
jgi:hypothetical protein